MNWSRPYGSQRQRLVGLALLLLIAAGCAQPAAPRPTTILPGAGAPTPSPIAVPTSAQSATATSATPTPRPPLTNDIFPTPQLDSLVRERREIRFMSDGVELAGELDLPQGVERPPVAVILHHSGPVPRDAYGYMAELLLAKQIAVFRFDKRGTGLSGGDYGCCEAADTLAAYRAAVSQPDIDPCRAVIIAQSLGTDHLALQYPAFASVQQPSGVVLLSSLLRANRIVLVRAPVLVVVGDTEPDLAAIGAEAVRAHQEQVGLGASLYIARDADHTLFDIRDGPIDWTSPTWPTRYHRGAMQQMLGWIRASATAPGCVS